MAPASGVSLNFSSPVNYIVVGGDNSSKSYTVTVTTGAANSDATLKSSSTIKGATITDLGTPNADISSVVAGSSTLSLDQAVYTTNNNSPYETLFDPTDSGATITKVVKYSNGESINNFETTDIAYNNELIDDQDFFIIKVTAQDGTTVRYYKVIVTTPCGSGSGIVSDPILICTALQLNNVRNNLSAFYKQVVDINLSSYSTGDGWDPIGDDTNKFTGGYDGSGYKISNLYINRPTEDYIGLFGYNEGGVISNVYLEGINVVGKSTVGGLVGVNNTGFIDYSYSTGEVSGTSGEVGGLVGKSGGTVSNSYSSCDVDGGWSIGGLMGGSWGSVLNSYSVGKVVAIGGDFGGLLGSYWGGSVSNSFYDKVTSGQSDAGKGDGHTTAWMKTSSNFVSAGWDFTNIWTTSGDTIYPTFIDPVYIQVTPTFDLGSGNIVFGSKVIITSVGADSIYYTLDGSDPVVGAINTYLYTGPVQIDNALTLKALATRTGYIDSPINSATYTQGTMCIIGPATPGGDWGTDTSMNLIPGTNFWEINTTLSANEMKFRACGNWNNNFGGVGFPSGIAAKDSPNISVVTAGDYYIVIDALTDNYNFYAPTPSVVDLIAGGANPVGGVTYDVEIPLPGAIDSTGLIAGWATGTTDTIIFIVADSGTATSSILINGNNYTSGTSYVISSTDPLNIVVTTSEAGKADAVRTFTVTVTATP